MKEKIETFFFFILLRKDRNFSVDVVVYNAIKKALYQPNIGLTDPFVRPNFLGQERTSKRPKIG